MLTASYVTRTGPGGGTRRLHHKHMELTMVVDFKEKCRIYYMVKGNLVGLSKKQIEESYDSYFKRLWGNHEAVYREQGFEENYRVFMMGAK